MQLNIIGYHRQQQQYSSSDNRTVAPAKIEDVSMQQREQEQ